MEKEQKKTGPGQNRAKYKTPEALQAAVDRYFESIAGEPLFDKHGAPVIDRNGNQIRAGATPPTLSGLAYYLGFKDRRTFTRQHTRGEKYADVVLTTRLKIEKFWKEASSREDIYPGAAFMLSMGFKWRLRDMQEATAAIMGAGDEDEDDLPEQDTEEANNDTSSQY